VCFLSNAIGNNGVLTGYVDVSGAALVGGYGFTANPNDYFIPTTPTLLTTFDLALTDTKFKFLKFGKQILLLIKSFLSVLEVR
jgi:hypothetical protein